MMSLFFYTVDTEILKMYRLFLETVFFEEEFK